MNDCVVIFCPPLSQYQEQPKDQSKCTAVDCPECGKKMWLSEKKEVMFSMAKAFGKEIWIGCYPCFEEHMTELVKAGKIMKQVKI